VAACSAPSLQACCRDMPDAQGTGADGAICCSDQSAEWTRGLSVCASIVVMWWCVMHGRMCARLAHGWLQGLVLCQDAVLFVCQLAGIRALLISSRGWNAGV
jgi:hypothetical protein